MTHLPASEALRHLKVLDLTRARAGPTCARQLADWGADVIKIEQPGGSTMGFDPHGSDYQNLHRNKRSVTLNLKKPEGINIFRRMAAQADVVIENYRPDVKHRLGIDYETLRELNQRLVYASISGFGQDGPYRERPGLDQIAQGAGGLMWVTGHPGDGPVRAGTAIADMSAGVFCAIGVLVALLEREKSGKGQWVRTSLLEAMISMMDFQAARWTMDGEVPPQAGNDHPTSIPTGAFATADGMLNIAASGDVLWRRFCEATDAAHLIDEDRFIDDNARTKNRESLNSEISKILKTRTTAEWIDLLNAAGVPCGAINKMDEVFADDQVRHLGMAAPVEHPLLGQISIVRQAVSMSRTPSAIARPSPESGADNREILKEFGLSDIDDSVLQEAGIL